MRKLSTQAIIDAGLTDWRKLAQQLHARFVAPDPASAAGFVAAIAEATGPTDNHPAISLRAGVVDVAVGTHEDGIWVTPQDVDCARQISDLAARHGLRPEPGDVTQLELALDTSDYHRVAPFWAALLTGSADNTIYDSVFDPTGRVPSVWFQRTEPHEAPRQRWHFDLWLAPEVAGDRIAAAVAAGGVVVDDAEAPSFTVLADPDGNRVCICTYLDRP